MRSSRPPAIFSPRVLLVYGSEPSGHAAAVIALEEAGLRAGLLISRLQVARDHHPFAGEAVSRAYHGLLRASPCSWGTLYRSDWACAALRAVRTAYLKWGGVSRIRAAVRREGADAIVCPQAAVAAVLAEARRQGELDVPVISVLTDYGVHPFWADPPTDLILCPTEDAMAALATLGVPRKRLRVTGIPVHPVFSALPERGQARRLLGLPSKAPIVLLSGGSRGLGNIDEAARALLRGAPRAHLLVLCGRNERLRRCLSTSMECGRLRVFGPQPPAFIALLLAASDLHVGKPGGLSVAESLAAGVPMVLTRPFPGQEEENARHLIGVGAAADGGGPAQAARRAVALLDDPAALEFLRVRAAAVGRSDAACRVVAELRGLLAKRDVAVMMPTIL